MLPSTSFVTYSALLSGENANDDARLPGLYVLQFFQLAYVDDRERAVVAVGYKRKFVIGCESNVVMSGASCDVLRDFRCRRVDHGDASVIARPTNTFHPVAKPDALVAVLFEHP